MTSAVARVEFVGDRKSCTAPRGHWHDIVTNVHAPTDNKSNASKGSFYEALQWLFNQFPTYHMKILL
jgi:hypothetical protein